MSTGVITVTNPGHVAAPGFVEQALANNPTSAGFVIYNEDKLFVSKVMSPDLATLNNLFELGKNMQVSCCMEQHPTGFLEEDIQPFVLVGTDKDPEIVCMLDGDWNVEMPDGTKHSPEFFVAIDHLRPIFKQLHKLTKGDLNAIIEEVESEATRTGIVSAISGRGTVHFMFGNGKVHSIEVGNQFTKEFPWGWVSNHFMYSEDKKPEPVVDKNPFAAALAGRTVLPKIVPKATEEVIEPTKVVDNGPRMITCPREIKNPHKIEKYYREKAGHVPPNYASYPTVEFKPKGPVASKEKVQELSSAFRVDPKTVATRDPKVLPDIGSTKEQIQERAPPKPGSTGPKIVAPVEPIKQPDLPKPVVEEKKDTSPAMSPEVQKKLVDKFLPETKAMVHTTDLAGKPIGDPKDAVALETKYTDFASRCGFPFEELYTWKVERLEKLIYEYPDAALHLICDLRLRLVMKERSVAQEPGKVTLPKINVRKTG